MVDVQKKRQIMSYVTFCKTLYFFTKVTGENVVNNNSYVLWLVTS